jgi:flagellar biosynthetic protein FliP
MRVGRWWWMALALTLGLTPMPVLRVSQAQSLMMVAGGTSSESFWVKSQTRNSSIGLTRTGLEEHKGKTTAKPSIGSRVAMDGLKKNNSIASELAGTKSVPWSIVLGLSFLTLIPALLLSMTPLVRLLVIFHFLRQALGTQTAPSNQVLMGLALMMTWFLIQPVLLEVEQQAVTPYSAGTITGMEAMERGVIPVKRYMLRYAREKDLAVFASAGMGVRPEHREDLPVQVVVPAYILSELKAGFQIGAILFLPFLLVDLVVASITTSIGMVQLPPVVISTPLKILLFVMVDGWNLLADQLIKSF